MRHRQRPIDMNRRHRAALAAVPLLLLTACGPQPGTGDPGAGSAPPAAQPADADEVVLRIEQTGGFVPPNLLVSRLPTATIYGDGRLITEGPVTMIYPGPALPNVQEVALARRGGRQGRVAQARRRGRRRGLTDLGQPPIADAPNTRFTVATDAGVESARGDGADRDRRRRAGYRAPSRRPPASSCATWSPRSPTGRPPRRQGVRVRADRRHASPWVASDASLPKPKEVAWPGPTLPGDPVGGRHRHRRRLRGDRRRQAARVVASAGANAATPWTSGGKTWSVALRPLLPDETGCADLRTG